MAKLLRLRRGTDTQHSSFTGAEGEVTVNTTNDSLHVHDGTTAGGRELLRTDLSNLPAGTIDNADISSSAAIANSKLATSGVTADTYGSSSAIPVITVNDRGIVTSATTSAIDSTSISNGTSNVSVAQNGDITATRGGTQRLAVTSTGIDVTGSVTCDGVTSDDNIVVNSGFGTVFIRDNNSSGNAAQAQIAYRDSSNAELGQIGYTDSTNRNLYINNNQSTDIRFRTGNQDRLVMNGGGTVFFPNANNTVDLGSSSNQFKDGYFDGTVNCDGLTSTGTNVLENTDEPQLILRDTDSSGSAARVQLEARGSDNVVDWFIGHTSTSNNSITFRNEDNQDIYFGTNGSNRVVLTSDGHWIPDVNNTYDLGSTGNRWRNVYTNDLNLSNEGGTNDVDGTWGSWTIQEGEDDLFLLNRRNGKKYKFNLSEVN